MAERNPKGSANVVRRTWDKDKNELRTARENARLEIGSQRGRNSHQMGVLGIYDLQGLSYGRTELLVADMRLLAPDPSGAPRGGRCHSTAIYAQPRHESRG